MLYIREGDASNKSNSQFKAWHRGEPIPDITQGGRTIYVVTFQADGDELECLLAAMRATSKRTNQCSAAIEEATERPTGKSHYETVEGPQGPIKQRVLMTASVPSTHPKWDACIDVWHEQALREDAYREGQRAAAKPQMSFKKEELLQLLDLILDKLREVRR